MINYIYIPVSALKGFNSLSSILILAVFMIVGLYLKFNYGEEATWGKNSNKKKKR